MSAEQSNDRLARVREQGNKVSERAISRMISGSPSTKSNKEMSGNDFKRTPAPTPKHEKSR